MTARPTVLAIDPGSEQSAWVLWDGERVIEHDKCLNIYLLHLCINRLYAAHFCVIEQIASYGMPVGADVFQTCVWSGRLAEALDGMRRRILVPGCYFWPRREVKLHLCGQARAKDSNIRQALIDKFGGKEAAIGKKAKPGPLYGIKADEWQALALAVVFMETRAASMVGSEKAPISVE